jgi:hypothetical protein
VDAYHAVVDLASAAVPLPPDTDRLTATFGNPRFIQDSDRFSMRMVLGHSLLATVMEFLFIPLDAFQETL